MSLFHSIVVEKIYICTFKRNKRLRYTLFQKKSVFIIKISHILYNFNPIANITIIHGKPLADLGGAHPQAQNFLNFLQFFLESLAKSYVGDPSLLRRILDPPLQT